MHGDGYLNHLCPSLHPLFIIHAPKAGTITGKPLFGQPCVNVRVQSAALPRLATGNSANKKRNDTMVKESEIRPGAFKALLTGYGMLGPYDYAHIPASSVPELSLAGDKPFTLFTSVCFKNVQGGAILTQENSFCFGIMDGLLYVAAVDWCAVKFSECTVGKFTTDHWYELAIVYDGVLLTVYLDGEKKDTFRCNPPKGKASKAELLIGKKLDAYFRTFRLFGKALSNREVSQLSSFAGITPEDSIAWFDFDQTGRKDRSPNRVKLTTKAFARIVMLHPVQQFRFNVSRRYHNVEEMVIEQFDSSKPISFTGLIGSKPDDDTHTQLTGTVSLGTPKPVMCELEGEIVTLWESTDIPQTD